MRAQDDGTVQILRRNIDCLAGFSDKTMDTLKRLDSEMSVPQREIKAVEM